MWHYVQVQAKVRNSNKCKRSKTSQRSSQEHRLCAQADGGMGLTHSLTLLLCDLGETTLTKRQSL